MFIRYKLKVCAQIRRAYGENDKNENILSGLKLESMSTIF